MVFYGFIAKIDFRYIENLVNRWTRFDIAKAFEIQSIVFANLWRREKIYFPFKDFFARQKKNDKNKT